MHKGLKILISSSFTFNIASASFGPLYAIFVEKIGGGILEASGVYAAQAITIGILIFLLGKVEDKINKRKILILGYFMQFVGITSYIFVQNIAQLFVVQIYLGIASAVTIPAFDAFYSKSLDRGKESSEWSVWESGTRIIAALAAIAGGFIAAEFGFTYLFVWMGFFSGIAAFSTLLLLRKKEYEKLFPPRF